MIQDPLVIVMAILSAALGFAVGSFLNVVIWRVPRGESVVAPPSACPRCGNRIRPSDNIPVLSWLLLRGRCRDCAEPISVRYPAVELLTAGLFVLVTLAFALGRHSLLALPAFLYLAAIAVALALIDIDVHRLPSAIVVPSYPVAIILLAIPSVLSGDPFQLIRALIGGAALFLFYFALAFAHPRGMGFGDVRLSGILGLYLGWLSWESLVVGAFAAFLLGGVFSVSLIIARRVKARGGIPFGPWMLVGAFVGIIAGDQIATGYLSAVGMT